MTGSPRKPSHAAIKPVAHERDQDHHGSELEMRIDGRHQSEKAGEQAERCDRGWCQEHPATQRRYNSRLMLLQPARDKSHPGLVLVVFPIHCSNSAIILSPARTLSPILT